MRRQSTPCFALALVLLLALLFLGCGSPTQTAGGTTDTGNSLDVLAGLVLAADSQPAGGAAVRLRRADYLSPPPSPLKRAVDRLDTVAGADGRFRIGDIDSGLYRLELGNGTTQSGLVELDLGDPGKHPDGRLDLPAVRLRKPAGVGGTAVLRADAAQAYVQVYGLERLSPVEAATGRFGLRLPSGKHRLRFIDPDCGVACLRIVDVTVSMEDTLDMGAIDMRDTTEPYVAWAHGARIGVNTAPGGADVAADVFDFPMLVRLDSSVFDFGQALPDGSDIRFSKPGGRKALAYEIERWDATLRQAEIWVKLDTVKGNDSKQYFNIHWGNAMAASASDGSAVFDPAHGYGGVWHLGEKGATAASGFKDATPNGNHGTGGGLTEASLVAGAIGGAQRFDGNDDEIRIANHPSLNFGTGDFTLALWARADSVYGKHQLICKRTDPGADYEIQVLADAKAESHVGKDPDHKIMTSSNTLAQGRWHHIVLQRRGASLAFYLDAEPAASGEDMPRDVDNGADLFLGRDPADALQERWNGGMDEVRVMRTGVSQAWIKLSFRSQQPGSKTLSWPLR